MIERRLLPTIHQRLDERPAVALLGPRQVGKTTLALDVAAQTESVYLDLESPSDRAAFADPALWLREHEGRLVVLDEVQRVPDVFELLRGRIDRLRRAGRRSGQLLLLGSASLELLRQSGESLAGRIAILELAPLSVLEVSDADTLWLRGGFPESFTAPSDAASMHWRRDFIRTCLERDIPMLGPRIPAETLRRFWTMLAHAQGGILNDSSLARGLDVDGKTITRYLDLLSHLLLVRRLPPWHGNIGKRLVKSPRVYVRDSGIVHALLGIDDREALFAHPVVGASWEGHVIETLLALVPEGVAASFYRSAAGAEIDLVLENFRGETLAIEVKLSSAPKPTRGFYQAATDVGADRRFVVYPGERSYPLDAETRVVGLEEMAQVLLLRRGLLV